MTAMVAAMILAPVAFRPPAIPLITHTPYFSAWCMSDKLTDGWPKHWTGGVNAAQGLVRIDGKPFRWMGGAMKDVPALEQKSVEVTPTRSIFTFEGQGTELVIEFMSPLIADDIELIARPLSYITATARATDGKPHEVEIYIDFTGEWVVDDGGKSIEINRHRLGGLEALTIRSSNAKPLNRSGDQVMIDWATLGIAAPNAKSAISEHTAARAQFATEGHLPADDDLDFPRPAGDRWPVAALQLSLGSVGQDATSRHLMVAMDERDAVEYFRRTLPPYWKRKGADLGSLLRDGEHQYESVRSRAIKFDESLTARLERAGGREYALMGALAYRQCLAGHTIVEDLDGDLLMFSKENSSNGCMGTVDVTFPAAPFFLALNPELLEAQLRPIFEYASSKRWPWKFAPHDIGQFPLANGQVYGGGERTEVDQMPVEESANMILMTAALAKEGRPSLAKTYYMLLWDWTMYLHENGIDPANQLCTDDFSGHLARNANLGAKAVLALFAWVDMTKSAEPTNPPTFTDDPFTSEFSAQADEWLVKAGENPTCLAFGQENTWSIKYNLVWARALNLDVFPKELVTSELAFYQTKANEYGIPLDNRATFTKVDWIFWAAAMGDRKTQDAMIAPMFKMLNATPDRVPFTDWSDTKTAKNSGFKARTVIGGIYMPLYVREKESGG
jgi:hypothetical protein